MGSTFASVYMSYRAMSAATAATGTVGNNISNMNTEGYTRQKTVLESQTLSGFHSRYDQNLISTGNGVAATTTVQVRDTFLDARYRAEYADTGRYNSISSGLADIENVLDEISTKGMQNQFDDFVNQLQNLSQYPTSKDIALVVRTSAQQMSQMLNVYATQLQQVRDQQAYDLGTVVIDTDFNSTVESIAHLNGQIREEYLYGNNPNELLDQRNSLIDKLSEMANIKVTITADEVADGLFLEHMTISMYDENTSTSIGLVDHTKANVLFVEDNGERVSIGMNPSFRLEGTPSNVDYDDITDYFTTGGISGYLDLLNGKGDYANVVEGENDFRGIQYYQRQLDTFAKTFAETYNKLNSIETTDATEIASRTSGLSFDETLALWQDSRTEFTMTEDSAEITAFTSSLSSDELDTLKEAIKKNPRLGELDVLGQNILKMPKDITRMTLQKKDLFTPADGSAEITAQNIAISSDWVQDSLFITTTKDITKANGLPEQNGGNDNIVRMISAVSGEHEFHTDPTDSTTPLKFTGTFNEYMISMGGTLALDVELNQNYMETSNTILASLDNSREATSGVSLDEEASNLLTFQSAYNAAARYFTALDEMLDKLINSTGLVGR